MRATPPAVTLGPGCELRHETFKMRLNYADSTFEMESCLAWTSSTLAGPKAERSESKSRLISCPKVKASFCAEISGGGGWGAGRPELALPLDCTQKHRQENMSQHSCVMGLMLGAFPSHLISLSQSYCEGDFDILNGRKETEAQRGFEPKSGCSTP